MTSPSLISDVGGMPHITTPSYAKEFRKVIESAAKGRQTFTVQVGSENTLNFTTHPDIIIFIQAKKLLNFNYCYCINYCGFLKKYYLPSNLSISNNGVTSNVTKF